MATPIRVNAAENYLEGRINGVLGEMPGSYALALQDELAALRARLAAVEEQSRDVRAWAGTVLDAYDRHQKPHKPVGAMLARALEGLRAALAASEKGENNG